jgi:two-component system, response regulator PdtaR
MEPVHLGRSCLASEGCKTVAYATDMAALRLTVLIVEDEMLVAFDLERIMATAGYSVLGPVATAEEALLLLRDNRPAAALLDVQLLNGMITPVAERLQTLRVPFVLVSGYTGPELQKPALANAPRVGKPVSEHHLLDTLAKALQAL